MKLTNFKIYNRVEQHRAFGLIGFKASFDSECGALRIRVGRYEREFELNELVDARPGIPKNEIRFAVSTHLLPNGPAHVTVEELEGRGAKEAKGTLAKFSLHIENEGSLADEVRHALSKAGAKAIFGPVIDSADFPYTEQFGAAWFDLQREPQIPLSFSPLETEDQAMAHLQAHGFCILPTVVPAELCDQLNAQADKEIAEGRIKYTWGSSQRLEGLHRLPAGRKIWTYEPVIRFLRRWFRDEPLACQSLYYMFGSQQDAHQDTIHLTPFPAGYMCGVWVALQDIVPDSGELFVYPGSHRSPRVRAEKLKLAKVHSDYSAYSKFTAEILGIIESGGYQKMTYRPQKGQILVWHENLIHGGSRQSNTPIARRSIVSHYFARGIVGYYDSRGEPAASEEMPASSS